MYKQKKTLDIPSLEEIEMERKRIKRSAQFRKYLRETINVLIVVAAVSVLIATLLLPILQISGISMEPTLNEGDIVVLFESGSFDRGDMIAFYYQSKVLLKRLIALPGDEIVIDSDGVIYVNGGLLNEPYVTEHELGECDLEFPYSVPQNTYFVIGDNRNTSIDSRSSVVGTIETDKILGVVFLRVWPLKNFKFFF